MSSGSQRNSKGKGPDLSLLDRAFELAGAGGNTSSSSISSSSNRNLVENNLKGRVEEPMGGKNNPIPHKKTSQSGHQNPQVSAKTTGDKPSTTSGASGKSTIL